MSDIVERLREACSHAHYTWQSALHNEAAAEIERLRAALDRIQGMCAVKDACACGRPRGIQAVRHCAVRALAGEKHD